MEDKELWEVIASAAWSGEETATLDLKVSLYDLADQIEKGEFLKDTCAIANSLLDQGTEGYLVFGVRDSIDCPDRTDAAEYVTGVTIASRDELERRVNQIMESHVDPQLALGCRILTPALTGIGKDIAVFVIRAWTEAHESDPHPYVVRQSVGRVRPGAVFIRRGTMAVGASRADIINLVGRHLRLEYEALESELRRQFREQSIVNEEKFQSLKMDFDKTAAEFAESIEFLTRTLKFKEKDLNKISADERAWRHIAFHAIEELHSRVPEDLRERKIRNILAQGGKDSCYEEVVWGPFKAGKAP